MNEKAMDDLFILRAIVRGQIAGSKSDLRYWCLVERENVSLFIRHCADIRAREARKRLWDQVEILRRLNAIIKEAEGGSE